MSADMIAGFSVNHKFWFPCPMDKLKQRRGKNRVCGPYYSTRKLIGPDHVVSFYLNSDFAPRLRWQWADEVFSSIRHTGWYTDEFGDGDTVRGLVMRLPGGRGFLAGWSMGVGMCSETDGVAYDDEISAALAADSWAEQIAQLNYERGCGYED